MNISTPQLAVELGIQVPVIHQRRYKYGHVYGYKPVGFEQGTNNYLWEQTQVKSNSETLTTPQLARKFGVKITTVRNSKCKYGHFKDYMPCGRVKSEVTLLWSKL